MFCYGKFSPLVSVKSVSARFPFIGDINEPYMPKARKWDNYKIWTVSARLIILFIFSLFSHLTKWVHHMIINVVLWTLAKEHNNTHFALGERKATPNPVITTRTGALPSLCSKVPPLWSPSIPSPPVPFHLPLLRLFPFFSSHSLFISSPAPPSQIFQLKCG